MRRIIIDCDPGHDDAVALLLALASPEALDIVGVTTVAGNIDVVQGERNARAICAAAGRPDIPVRAGCARPLVNPFRDASDFHGKTGMDGWSLGLPTEPAHPEHAVDFIMASLRAAEAPLTLVCLAPLTNIAVALIKDPSLTSKIDEIIVAGGARRAGGNVTPCATFNLVCDPHAAHVVFESGCRITALSFDASSRIIVGPAELARLKALDAPAAAMSHDIVSFFNRRRIEVYGYGEDQTALTDPCLIAYLLEPDLFGGRKLNIMIEHRSDLTSGMTVVDVLGVTGRPRNALWIDEIDKDGVIALFERVLARSPVTASAELASI
jgi:purine nucleosidase